MVFFGSVIVVLLLCFGIWYMLSPLFKKIGDKIKNKISQFQENELEVKNNNKKEND